ncbi:MAG: alpha/beta hydrolase [Burkholderiales bacterium]
MAGRRKHEEQPEKITDRHGNLRWHDASYPPLSTEAKDAFVRYTAVDSGAYEISDAAEEVMRALRRRDSLLRELVMAYAKIVFVAHSLGGVVTRYLLEKHREEFKAKKVGLMLYASPSYGSKWGDKMMFFTPRRDHAIVALPSRALKTLSQSIKAFTASHVSPSQGGIALRALVKS